MKKCLWMTELEERIKRPLRTKKIIELEMEREMKRVKEKHDAQTN